MNEIIGLPAIVLAQHRIVIDKNLRKLLKISESGSVQLLINRNRLQIFPHTPTIVGAVVKEISIGRFNLPMDWVHCNGVKVGSHVFLVATEDCLLVCLSSPKSPSADT